MRLLRQSDAQLFAGWGDHNSISDESILCKIGNLADAAASLLKVMKGVGLICSMTLIPVICFLQENERTNSKNVSIIANFFCYLPH